VGLTLKDFKTSMCVCMLYVNGCELAGIIFGFVMLTLSQFPTLRRTKPSQACAFLSSAKTHPRCQFAAQKIQVFCFCDELIRASKKRFSFGSTLLERSRKKEFVLWEFLHVVIVLDSPVLCDMYYVHIYI
jgi:hypothetical protein